MHDVATHFFELQSDDNNIRHSVMEKREMLGFPSFVWLYFYTA